MPRSFLKGNSEVIEFLGGELFPILNAKVSEVHVSCPDSKRLIIIDDFHCRLIVNANFGWFIFRKSQFIEEKLHASDSFHSIMNRCEFSLG